jgi:hypothetical protein
MVCQSATTHLRMVILRALIPAYLIARFKRSDRNNCSGKM